MNPLGEHLVLPGETSALSTSANATFDLDLTQNDLAPGPGRALLVTASSIFQLFTDQPGAIGGALHLTNYRLLFVAHGLNLKQGHFSVFLPTIRGTSSAEGAFSDQLTVETGLTTQRFVVPRGEAAGVILALEDAQKALGAGMQPAALQALAMANLDRSGEGLHAIWRSEPHHEPTLDGLRAAVERGAASPWQVVGLLNLLELQAQGPQSMTPSASRISLSE